MSLLEALLLDSYRMNVWIAYRTDGVAGSGTQSDPFDGSTQAKFLPCSVEYSLARKKQFPISLSVISPISNGIQTQCDWPSPRPALTNQVHTVSVFSTRLSRRWEADRIRAPDLHLTGRGRWHSEPLPDAR
jgi:hypothetical protein